MGVFKNVHLTFFSFSFSISLSKVCYKIVVYANFICVEVRVRPSSLIRNPRGRGKKRETDIETSYRN